MLDKNDEKIIEKIVNKVTIKVVGSALEEIVLPRIQKLEDGSVDLKVNVTDLKEDVTELKGATARIELKLDAVVKRQDDQSDKITHIDKRVLKLEKISK